MTREEHIKFIKKQLSHGDLDKALKSLESYVKTFSGTQEDDVAMLKATFLNAKRQFDLQGLMSRQEFDLVFARTINGIQTILQQDPEIESSHIVSPNPPPKSRICLVGIISFLLVLGIGSSYWFLNAKKKTAIVSVEPTVESTTKSTIPQTKSPKENNSREALKNDQVSLKPIKKKTSPTKNQNQIPKNEPIKTAPIIITIKNEPAKPAPKEYLQVKLIVNASHSKANIFIDGKAAQVLQNTPIIKTIRVEKKEDMHHIELKNGDRPCTTDILIHTEGQKIILNC